MMRIATEFYPSQKKYSPLFLLVVVVVVVIIVKYSGWCVQRVFAISVASVGMGSDE